jgi:hypothetical protein
MDTNARLTSAESFSEGVYVVNPEPVVGSAREAALVLVEACQAEQTTPRVRAENKPAKTNKKKKNKQNKR